MTKQVDGQPKMVSAEISLGTGDFQMKARVSVPAGPTECAHMLPIIRSLSDAVCQKTAQAVEQVGEKISCAAGCGSCCRHLVAISEIEARRIRVLVENLPEPRQTHVRNRFDQAIRELADAGVLDEVRQMRSMSDDQYESLAERYFSKRVACPFLEEESCSIHPERPITCREYMVTSSPEYCAEPRPEAIRRVRVLLPIFNALAWWQIGPTKAMTERWVPLILALEWAAANPDDPPAKPGPELLGDFLNSIAQVSEDPLAEAS